jgi:hypothetical protein
MDERLAHGLPSDQCQALVLGEVFEVLDVEGRQRQAVGERTGRDPRVVGGPRPATSDGVRGDLAPGASDIVAVWKDDQSVEPVPQGVTVAPAPLSKFGPLGQFAERYERDARLFADEPGHDR